MIRAKTKTMKTSILINKQSSFLCCRVSVSVSIVFASDMWSGKSSDTSWADS
jgi:hypothetical protein